MNLTYKYNFSNRFDESDSGSEPRIDIAVIIPYYNGGMFIKRALESVYSQTAPAREVIVVDDGSCEDEANILLSLQPEYGFRLERKPNGGIGSARNYGVALCESNYICFLDQDDFYLPDHNKILKGAVDVNDKQLAFVYGDLYHGDEYGNIIRTGCIPEYSKIPKTSITQCLRNDLFILPSASIIRKTAFEKVGGFDDRLSGYEDDDLFLRLFRAGFTQQYIDRSVTVWCHRASSTSYSIKMMHSRMIYFAKLCESFPDDPFSGNFYFRDCIAPRFEKQLVMDAVSATIADHKDKAEYVSVLKHYEKMVLADKTVRFRRKCRLRIFVFAIGFPRRLLSFLYGFARLCLRVLRR